MKENVFGFAWKLSTLWCTDLGREGRSAYGTLEPEKSGSTECISQWGKIKKIVRLNFF